MSVPQWTYDEVFFAQGKPNARVAVLVPRRAIAEGLANYISKTRRVKLGEEVGLGVGGNFQFGDASRLVFMTYGAFAAISRSDENFSKWDAVLLDEAHERNPDADLLLPMMVKAAKARPDFRAVVMSATIDEAFFGAMIARNMAEPGTPDDRLPAVPFIKVEGVTFPVEDVWADQDWDPQADGSITNLVAFVLQVYRKESKGNVLVFLPTIAMVDEGPSFILHSPCDCQDAGSARAHLPTLCPFCIPQPLGRPRPPCGTTRRAPSSLFTLRWRATGSPRWSTSRT